MKGFSSGTIHGKLGIRAGNTGYFSLQDVRVPQANMVGEEGEGFKIAMFALEQGRYTVAAGATGCDSCFKRCVSFLRETRERPLGQDRESSTGEAKDSRDWKLTIR
jgi:glutaryl-CoA dehydrogenase (non-decarboxylating)